ncbi:MAG: hypothetical protein Kow0062_02730 [Acidobacteriota bacterium]
MTNRTRWTRLAVLMVLAVPVALVGTTALADWELGMTYYKQGKYVEAIAEFEATLATAPEYDFGYYMVGNCYLKLKKYNDAVVNYKKAIDLEPGKFAYHAALAQAQLILKRYSDVVATLDRAESLASNAREKQILHRTRGLALANLKQWQRAIADLKQAQPEKNFSIALALGGACRATGDFACSKSAFEKALKLEPDNEAALSQYTSALLESAVREKNDAKAAQDYKRAVEIARRLVKVNDTPDAHKKLGDALLGAKRYKEAVAEYQQVLAREPNNCAAMLSIAQALVPLEDWNGTVEWGRKAASCGKNKHLGYNQMAFAYIKMHKWDEAIAAADKSLAVKPNSTAQQLKQTAIQKKETELHNKRIAEEEKRQQELLEAEKRRLAEEERKRREWEIRQGIAKGDKSKEDGSKKGASGSGGGDGL